MRTAWQGQLRRSAALGALALLGACSGGGGGGGGGFTPPPAPAPTPAPTPTPVPTPTPTPTPTPIDEYDTIEYRATIGAVSMNALTAYDSGATGAGIRVAVIDSGIDLQSQEFGNCAGGIGTGSCRITGASEDVAGNSSIDDEDGHGTAVAFTIAGRRNEVGTHGVSFDAELVVLRADEPGTCAGEDPDDPDSGCSFSDASIAEGLDAARLAGARVVNISLGSDTDDGPPGTALTQAIGRATAAGMIIVLAAGNEGEPNPNPLTTPATNASVSRGLVIIAGSVNGDDRISSFSNRAGTGQNVFLAAVGERVRAPDADNQASLWSGTSFSAPQIAGAIALLAQAFPNLSGSEIVELLYMTARDAGAPGIDPVYGRGVLDLARAFAPVGSMSLAGSDAAVSDTLNAALSAPMGDAQQGALGAVVLDGFDRAYSMDLARSISRQGPARRLPALMASRQRSFAVGMGEARVAVTLVPTRDSVRIERLAIGTGDAGRARALAASVTARLGTDAQFAIGASESGNALAARLAGRDDPAFLVARDPVNSQGFDSDVGGSLAVRQQFGGWGVSVAQEQGDVLTRRDTTMAALRWKSERFGYSRTTLGLDRNFGGLRLGVSATRLAEEDSVLGARFSGALGATRASSVFLDLGMRWDMGEGWQLGGSMRQGWTMAELRGGVEGSGLLRTNGFAADVGKLGVLGAADRLGLRIAQPLRVARGGIDIALPGGWDYASESVTSWNVSSGNGSAWASASTNGIAAPACFAFAAARTSIS